jgi:hypothetical protein
MSVDPATVTPRASAQRVIPAAPGVVPLSGVEHP